MATLEGLAVYWNSQTQLLQRMGQKVQMMEALRDIVLQDTPDLTYSILFCFIITKINLLIIFIYFNDHVAMISV